MIYSLPVRQADGSHRLFDTLSKQYDVKQDVETYLFGQKPDVLKIYCIPTWECTLRCPYCYVLQNLRKSDRFRVDTAATIAFLKRYLDWSAGAVKNIRILQIGGEPFANMANVEAYAEVVTWLQQNTDAKVFHSTTTNLTVLPEDLSVIHSFDHIGVSIDGDEEAHNSVRKNAALPEGTNVFRTTLKNLVRLIDAGMADRITIQAALGDEFQGDTERIRAFRFLLEALGVPPERITMGCVAPTNGREPTETFKRFERMGGPVTAPCCIFRPMGFLGLHNNRVFANYFNQDSVIGDLETPMDELASRSADFVRQTMPVLQDPVCRSCDVIGYCWGRCYGAEACREKPSEHCNQSALRERVHAAAADGTLPRLVGVKQHSE